MRLAACLLALLTAPCPACAAGEVAYAGLAIETPELPSAVQATYAAPPASYPAPASQAWEPDAPLAPLHLRYHNPWYGGVDFGVTRFSHTNSTYAVADDNVGLSVRPYLGWESPRGVGVRVRAWLYGIDSTALDAGTGNTFDLSVAAASLDFDFYRRLWLDETSLLFGVGSKSAALGFEYPNGTEDTHSASGLSVFMEGYHPFRITPHSEWGLIGSGRVSYLVGQSDYDNSSLYATADTAMMLGEAMMGVQYRRHFRRADFLFQLQSEVQLWQINGVADAAFTTTGFRFGAEW